MIRMPSPIGIYAILDTGTLPLASLPAAAAALAAGGIRMFQVRAKEVPGGEMARLVREIRAALPDDAVLLVNDRADVARVTDADGVHVGDQDILVSDARMVLATERSGPRLVGLSTHSPEEAGRAGLSAPDYIGVGPIFSSRTKSTGRPELGLAGLRRAVEATSLPVVAIGGIGLADVAAVRQTGASGIAMIAELLVAGEFEARARMAVDSFARCRREPDGGAIG